MKNRIFTINPKATAPTALIEVDTTKAQLNQEVKWTVTVCGVFFISKKRG